ncbi:energy-coupling factor ABC transporter ATP-binding protein [Berryella wangjianweii]|uniref:energy-coupling factor ABC transporter ATP-binding protein n=1 Tax=Berryella wangjianweii TaxID=2734634 RepID=UPI0021BD7EEF|nr:ABC transporter ATP-binding protein [Berryella wangjianweii]
MESMVQVERVTFRYREGTEPVLRDVSLRIPAGSFVGVTGAAGSGKSTLTYLMNGIVPHCYPGDFYGTVRVAGLDTCDTALTDLARVVGSVCQDIDSQMVAAVVEDELLFGLESFAVSHDQVEGRIEGALADMGIADLRHRAIASLSGGQRQKVAIAAILALRPRVLVLDEPTAELDPASSRTVFHLLAGYARRHGATVVAVEQKIALLAEFADRIVVMEEGRVRFDDEPAVVLAHADELLSVGVNCPRSCTVMNRLRQRGAYEGPTCRTPEQAASALREVLS